MGICKMKHHNCSSLCDDCCHDCSEYQQEQCIEYDKICDCQWDAGCSLNKELYMKAIKSEESYNRHVKENLPNNIILTNSK
jgi:hypothetical protein